MIYVFPENFGDFYLTPVLYHPQPPYIYENCLLWIDYWTFSLRRLSLSLTLRSMLYCYSFVFKIAILVIAIPDFIKLQLFKSLFYIQY